MEFICRIPLSFSSTVAREGRGRTGARHMPQSSRLEKEAESHLKEGNYWKTSGKPRGKQHVGDAQCTDSSEEETRLYNEQIDRDSGFQTRQERAQEHKRKGRGPRKDPSKKRRSEDGQENPAQLAKQLSELQKTMQQILSCTTPGQLQPFLPPRAMQRNQAKEGKEDEGKCLAKQVAHTHRQKESAEDQLARERKRMIGIVKAWTYALWLWEGAPQALSLNSITLEINMQEPS